jgi:hypothetical protein
VATPPARTPLKVPRSSLPAPPTPPPPTTPPLPPAARSAAARNEEGAGAVAGAVGARAEASDGGGQRARPLRSLAASRLRPVDLDLDALPSAAAHAQRAAIASAQPSRHALPASPRARAYAQPYAAVTARGVPPGEGALASPPAGQQQAPPSPVQLAAAAAAAPDATTRRRSALPRPRSAATLDASALAPAPGAHVAAAAAASAGRGVASRNGAVDSADAQATPRAHVAQAAQFGWKQASYVSRPSSPLIARAGSQHHGSAS